MKKYLLSLVAILAGFSITGSSGQEIKPARKQETKPEIELRRSNYRNPELSTRAEFCYSFRSEKEIESTLGAWRKGEITSGAWKSLKLKKYSLENKSSLEKVAQEPSPSVETFLRALKSRFPTFDSLHPIKKAQLIYDTVRTSFRFRANPYDKLRIGDISANDLVKKQELIQIRAEPTQPYQSVEETFKFGSGICINLSTLLYSMYSKAGINCSLVFQDNCTGNDHVFVAFEALPGRFLPIDPTRSEADFVKNISDTQKDANSSLVRSVSLLNPRVSTEALNLTDYL